MPRGRDTDACPGALQVHQAADGAMARIRLPGGMITAAQLATLADVSTRLGSGTLELTARGNVQVRGITDVAAVGDAIAAAGLLPSATHERVRNIVASPLSGRVGGNVDVREWVGELDAAICAEPRLAELGGRFWFSLDDGRADVSGLGADAGVHWFDDGCALLLAGSDTGIRVAVTDVASTLIGVAMRFLEIRGKAWRINELDDLRELVPDTAPSAESFPPVTKAPVGWMTQIDGRVTLGAAVPLGVLPARVAEYLAAVRGPAGDHTVAIGAGVRPRRRGGGRRAPRARAAGPGVRRELALADRQRLHGQPRLRAFGRRCASGRRSGVAPGISCSRGAPPLRRLRTSLRQSAVRRSAGGHRRRVSAASQINAVG